MKSINNKKGQILIETALVLVILLVIILGITEFSRAWFTKNSLKNAVRQGARVAAVTPAPLTTSFQCTSTTTCPNTNSIINAVCCQPGVKPKTGEPAISVTITCNDSACGNPIPAGTIIKVSANYNNTSFFIVGGGMWPWSKALNITVDASMRYE